MDQIKPLERPPALASTTYKITTGQGRLYITISNLNDMPFEVFCSIGKSGYSTMADAEAIGRLISLAIRSGISMEAVIAQLKGIGGNAPTFHDGSLVQSIPDAIAQVLEKHTSKKECSKEIIEEIKMTKDSPKTPTPTILCPMCGAEIPEEKCPTCPHCAWTKCGGS